MIGSLRETPAQIAETMLSDDIDRPLLYLTIVVLTLLSLRILYMLTATRRASTPRRTTRTQFSIGAMLATIAVVGLGLGATRNPRLWVLLVVATFLAGVVAVALRDPFKP